MKTQLRQRNIYLLFCLVPFSGCVFACRPDECETAQLAMSELAPIALDIQDAVASNNAAPESLAAVVGHDLPVLLAQGAVLSQKSDAPSEGYKVTLPNSDEVSVFYYLLGGNPNFSFEYYSRWGRETCFWEFESTNWICFRR